MSSSANVLQALTEAFNERAWERAHDLMIEDVEFVDVASGVTTHGPQGFVDYARGWANGFPDMHIETISLLAEGTMVAGEFRGSGTHDGTLPTPAGEIPPTGRPFSEPFVFVADVVDGKLAKVRDYYNTMSMMAQLGLMPEPTTAT
jgi:predicted ester cyclase